MTLVLELGALAGIITTIKLNNNNDYDEDYNDLVYNLQQILYKCKNSENLYLFTSKKIIIDNNIRELLKLIPPESKFHKMIYILRDEYNKLLEMEKKFIEKRSNEESYII